MPNSRFVHRCEKNYKKNGDKCGKFPHNCQKPTTAIFDQKSMVYHLRTCHKYTVSHRAHLIRKLLTVLVTPVMAEMNFHIRTHFSYKKNSLLKEKPTKENNFSSVGSSLQQQSVAMPLLKLQQLNKL